MLISAGTKNLMKTLKENPNYDIMNLKSICDTFIPSVYHFSNYIWQDASTVLNLYLPMRLHPMTRGAINNIILRYKPSKEQLYFKELEKNE
mmetsp:Transcript_24721/g.38495  ORF Transcript_24721/g.38495 Transcript_24721/m.38495 type:complete len:91 (+) Transcript_24721:998-1270(+)